MPTRKKRKCEKKSPHQAYATIAHIVPGARSKDPLVGHYIEFRGKPGAIGKYADADGDEVSGHPVEVRRHWHDHLVVLIPVNMTQETAVRLMRKIVGWMEWGWNIPRSDLISGADFRAEAPPFPELNEVFGQEAEGDHQA